MGTAAAATVTETLHKSELSQPIKERFFQ